MSALTVTAGYPVHRVAQYARWANQHGANFTDWVAPCGFGGTASGHPNGYTSPFGKAGSARRLELCPNCFPGRDMHGHFPDPIEVPSERGVQA